MRIKNTTDIPNDLIRDIVHFVRPSGIKNFDVMIKNGSAFAGMAYPSGCRKFHGNSNPFVVCRIPSDVPKIIHGFLGSRSNPITWTEKYYPRFVHPYQYAHLKGKKYVISNKIEALVYLLAHELRHLWQGKAKNKSGYYPRSKGKFSEVDTESYAIHCLREFRRQFNYKTSTL